MVSGMCSLQGNEFWCMLNRITEVPHIPAGAREIFLGVNNITSLPENVFLSNGDEASVR